jgi:hypothetical protein
MAKSHYSSERQNFKATREEINLCPAYAGHDQGNNTNLKPHLCKSTITPSHLFAMLDYTSIVHFLCPSSFGLLEFHLLVDLGEDTEKICQYRMQNLWEEAYSWSLNREYSSSPTLTGEPPY